MGVICGVFMSKQPQKRFDGWVYVVRWGNDLSRVKIGFTTDIRQRFIDYLTYSDYPLVILKAFRANKDEEINLHSKFQACRRNGEWFLLTPALELFLREQAVCQTKEAKKVFGSGYKERVLWRPMIPFVEQRLEEAKRAKKLPGYVSNSKRYVLWAIDDLVMNDYICVSSAIINHQANAGVYQEKTIYNTLNFLMSHGLVIRNDCKEFALTERGVRALDLLRGKRIERQANRRSVESLTPSI